jgi:RNA polymerase sigma-70 factor (family 1)
MTVPEKHLLFNEKELLFRVAEGDQLAFTQLYSFYQPRLLRFVLAFAFSRHYAEDIVQDTLFKLWTRRETLIGILSLEKYLMRMARNKLLDHLKKQATERKHIGWLSVEETVPSNVSNELLLKEYNQIAWNAINQLPEKQREIFLMRHRQDMTLDEIAAALHSNRAAVQKNLTRALHFIKTRLHHHDEWGLLILYLLMTLPEVLKEPSC